MPRHHWIVAVIAVIAAGLTAGYAAQGGKASGAAKADRPAKGGAKAGKAAGSDAASPKSPAAPGGVADVEDSGVDEEDIQTETLAVPAKLSLRARVTKMTPPEVVRFRWRYGGEGLGGNVTSGILGESGQPELLEEDTIQSLKRRPPDDPMILPGGAKDDFSAIDRLIKDLQVGEWSPYADLKTLGGHIPKFVTFTVGGGKTRGVEVEFELSFQGKAIKTFREAAPDGGTVTIVIPTGQLSKGPTSPEFLDHLSGLSEYVKRRADALEKLPWNAMPRPKLFGFIGDLGGYGEGGGYGVRHSNKEIVDDELRSFRALGINGFRAMPGYLRHEDVFANEFARTHIGGAMGYPVAAAGNSGETVPEQGCPFAPGVAERTAMGVANSMKNIKLGVQEAWCLTVDEIGAVGGGAPEGRAHMTVCPYCIEGFREFLKSQGRKPQDFGKQYWQEIKPYPIWGTPKKTVAADPNAGPYAAPSEAASEPARANYREDPNEALLAYYTLHFVNYASGRLFHPLGEAYEKANAAKRAALAAGKTDSPEARQPWLYAYALRGNTFLMGGSSLDFFDFYRYGENGFMYETSNRDARIWSWDSYLCDVGRTLSTKMGKGFGIYVKPHRGAPVQRALSAASRGARTIYWYCYGPDYSKGDCYSQNMRVLQLVSKAGRLIGKTEDVLFGAQWAQPAQVAIVRPRTTELWWHLGGTKVGPADWENGKWLYTALTHAHIPVDALDETLLASEDLSRYKAICISGSNITADVAAKLAKYVEAGGILYTSAGGLARDERNQPLTALQPVLGLASRGDVQQWNGVPVYGATGLGGFGGKEGFKETPAGAIVTAGKPLSGSFSPAVGREALSPADGTTVLATFADGSAAMTCKSYGKGKAYVAGFYPGLEYSASVRKGGFDMSKDFSDELRAYVAEPLRSAVQPPVAPERPTVEALMLKNPKTGKQAITLMNWAYSSKTLVPCKDLKITIRAAGIKKVISAWLDKELPIKAEGPGAISVVLPELEEGDVLLVE